MSNPMSKSKDGGRKRTFKEHDEARKKDEDILFADQNDADGENSEGNDQDQDATGTRHELSRHMAEEDDGLDEDADGEMEPEDAEDLADHEDDDYKAMPELDRYDVQGIDDDQQDQGNFAQRREAERELHLQDRQQIQGRSRGPAALIEGDSDDEDVEGRMLRQQQLRMGAGMFADGAGGNQDDPEDLGAMNDYADSKGPLSQWIQKKEVINFISSQFGSFLRTFRDQQSGQTVYEDRIQSMCQRNRQSFEINFTDLSSKQPTLAIWLAEEPSRMFPVLNQVASDIVSEIFPEYNLIHHEIFVRIGGLPVEDKLRELRQVHLNALIKFRGVVTKRTGVYPQYQQIYFRCECGDIKGPCFSNDQYAAKQELGSCLICQRRGSFTVDEAYTIYRNYQKLTIQETPGTVPPGRVPRQKEVFVIHDLVDTARPGDEVEITGIYINRFDYFGNIKHGFPVFQTIVEANNLKRFGDEDIVELTDEDKQEIRKLSRTSDIGKKIVNSIAPSIYGHEFVKRGIALAMFGGMPKDVGGKHKIRGDINMLLLGDPGTAKSQFLKWIESTYHRVVYTTGKGASAVGLTAGVHKDPITGEWTLEGGALVLADKGICLIDEFDKMNDSDRTSIHEAMEQQSISISKAGIITSLQARCSVIAAANPIGGVYKPNQNFNDNVDLTDPILSRFDVLSVIRDEPQDDLDDALATFVINSHMKNHPVPRTIFEEDARNAAEQEDLANRLLDESNIQKTKAEMVLDQELLKKYIIYAKRHVSPKLNEIDKDKVTDFYAAIRQASSAVGGIPIAVRHIESVIRMSEAYAKIHLRDYVRSDDIDFAIDMMLESFLQSQKLTVARVLSKKLDKYKSKVTDVNSLLLHILKKLADEQALLKKVKSGIEETERVAVEIKINHFKGEARDFNAVNIDYFLKSSFFKRDFKIVNDTISTVREI